METRFTPGPWTTTDVGTGTGKFVRLTTEDEKRNIGTVNIGYLDTEGIGNSYLISAAPDLYAACEQAQALLRDFARPLDDEGYAASQTVSGVLRAALAIARGESGGGQ